MPLFSEVTHIITTRKYMVILDSFMIEVLMALCLLWSAWCFETAVVPFGYMMQAGTPLTALIAWWSEPDAWAVGCVTIAVAQATGLYLLAVHKWDYLSYFLRLIGLGAACVFFFAVGAVQLHINSSSLIAMPCIMMALRGAWNVARIGIWLAPPDRWSHH